MAQKSPGWCKDGHLQVHASEVAIFGARTQLESQDNGKSPVSAHVCFGHYFLFQPLVKVLVKAPCGLHHIITHTSVWAPDFWIWIGLWGWQGRQPLDWKF